MRKITPYQAQPPPRNNPHSYASQNQPSYTNLAPQNQYMMARTMETSTDQLVQQQKNTYKQFQSDTLDKLAKADYQPAKYTKAVQYRNERSYKKKINDQYQQLDLFCNTDELRYFGLGTYFYIEFFRRMMWFFFVLTLINGASIYINFKGTGLSNYSVSFSSYLINTTLGNYSGTVLSLFDTLIVAVVPALNFLALLIFYWIWKVHFLRAVATQEQDNKDVKPQKFCVEIEGLPEGYVREEDLVKFFTSFGPVYEVSLARNYDNKLSYFEDIDQLQEQIKELQLEMVLENDQSNRKTIQKKKNELQKLQYKLKSISIKPYTVSAFVHFQFQKSKVECLSHFNDHYLFKNNSCHSCMRTCCCCCIKQPDSKLIYDGNTLMIGNSYPPPPQDINWLSFEIGFCNKLFRVIFAFLIIVAFLIISCTIIGMCSIYIQTHSSNCEGINTASYNPTTVVATGNTTIIKCYCNANLVASFSSSSIQAACGDNLKGIYIEQGVQYAVIVTSAVTNILFGLISDRLVNFVRPSSFSNTLRYKTAILTLFFTLNSILIPVLIYANIFGFTPANYVSFLTIFSSGIRNFLQVETLSFYATFTPIWYRNVSPIFSNFILFNIISLWVSYIFFKCCCSSKDSLQDKQNRILQKTMNQKITEFKFEIQKQAASLYLIIIMTCMFWSGIPVLVPLAFLNIMSRYIINRSLLQNHSIRIPGLGQQFNSLSIFVLAAILILLPSFSEWMVIANSVIYPNGLQLLNFSLSFLKGYHQILDLQLYLPFYLGVSILALGQILVYNLLIKCCSSVCSLCYEKKEANYHARPYAEYTKSLNIQCSYNVRNNDHLRNAILNLEKYLIQNDK